MAHSLEVFAGGKLVFASDEGWIHPLFALERFLAESGCRPQELVVWDRVVGRAAALVMAFLGVAVVRAGVLSVGGREVLERHGIVHSWQQLVERIGCQTEELLARVEDPEQAFAILRGRAALERGS